MPITTVKPRTITSWDTEEAEQGGSVLDESGEASLNAEQFCYLETIGRVTGRPHTVEMWYAAEGRSLYLLSGGGDRADWVRNLRHQPRVRVRIATRTFDAEAEIVANPGEEARARELLAAKYYGWHGGALPNEWARSALPVVLRLDPVPSSDLSSVPQGNGGAEGID